MSGAEALGCGRKPCAEGSRRKPEAGSQKNSRQAGTPGFACLPASVFVPHPASSGFLPHPCTPRLWFTILPSHASSIHATAIVDPTAELAEGVRIDAYAVVGAGVSIGAGTTIGSHSVIQGPTAIGSNCTIGPAAYVGLEPQHLEFLRRPAEVRQQSWLVIGDGTIIRESASVHRASKPGRENATRIGNQCLLMGGSHIAHDCVVADNVTMANGALLGGHCNISPRAFLGGSLRCINLAASDVSLAMVAGNESIGRDVPPFAAMFHGGLGRDTTPSAADGRA